MAAKSHLPVTAINITAHDFPVISVVITAAFIFENSIQA